MAGNIYIPESKMLQPVWGSCQTESLLAAFTKNSLIHTNIRITIHSLSYQCILSFISFINQPWNNFINDICLEATTWESCKICIPVFQYSLISFYKPGLLAKNWMPSDHDRLENGLENLRLDRKSKNQSWIVLPPLASSFDTSCFPAAFTNWIACLHFLPHSNCSHSPFIFARDIQFPVL